MGFTVTIGGTNGPTHNALIVFSDNTYIELIALRSSFARSVVRAMRRLGALQCLRWFTHRLQTRFIGWLGAREGLVDICLRGADLTQIDQASPLSSMSLTRPASFKRHRPDGVVVEWVLRGSTDLGQPFFIEDVTPIEYRIPTGDARVHQNGASGIVEIRTSNMMCTAVSNMRFTRDPALRPGSIVISIHVQSTFCAVSGILPLLNPARLVVDSSVE